MRLNHLEIAGFKSFAERAALAFDDGVTAIVGPNGCGKSNVIDAITWVLGEQSARSLRGERMEDVIFSGSDARRPTAAAEVRIQLSEVTAALANGGNGNALRESVIHPANGDHATNGDHPPNGDYPANGKGNGADNDHAGAAGPGPLLSAPAPVPAAVVLESLAGEEDVDFPAPSISRDVEVARRLYRSGESEYLIDGRVCRLRDIQDLLMDSGLGVKAYAVIEQGRIGQILSARPTERRQLLEEAAGVTKYRVRRRTAELKLEAAQQNLTRVDDIIFEVERQRSALKRQAAKARRYRRLRDELRRWQKVSFARRSKGLAAAIETAARRLDEAAAGERGAAAALAGLESGRESLRLGLVETDREATTVRENAHRRELEIERCQQQIDFGKRRAAELATALEEGIATLAALEARRAPVGDELAGQREAHERCIDDRDVTLARLQEAEAAFSEAQQAIEGREGDVEAARSEMFAAVNAAAALQSVIDNATATQRRIADAAVKIDAEAADLETEIARIRRDRASADAARNQGQERLDAVRADREARAAELESVRSAVESLTRELRQREQQVAVMQARVESLEELQAGRAAYGEAAREVLAAGSKVAHHGSVADHVEVERRDESAAESCLADLLQDVVVPSRDDALAGVALAASRDKGRCGFVVADEKHAPQAARPPHPALRALTDVVGVTGIGAATVRRLLQRRWVAPSLEDALAAARKTEDPIATPEGTVVRGPHRITGGGGQGAGGLLAPKREIKELRKRIAAEGAAVEEVGRRIAEGQQDAARREQALGALQQDEHALEKELVGLDMGLSRLDEELTRVTDRQSLVATERGQLTEERAGLEAREAEAREAIARLEAQQRAADDRFMEAERRLHEARASVETLGRDAAGAKARHATMAERAAAIASDVKRLEEQADELRERIAGCEADNERAVADRVGTLDDVTRREQQLDADIQGFDALRKQIVELDERAGNLRERIAAQDDEVRTARRAVEQARAEVGKQEVALATAEADLSHLTESCSVSLQTSLEDVRAEVEALEAQGPIEPDPALIGTQTPVDVAGDDANAAAIGEPADVADGPRDEAGAKQMAGSPPADPQAVVDLLQAKVERLGAVNMMAIDQFDELEERHGFLTAQRQDLLDSISATGAAIKRIDATTRSRFQEAFKVVNEHFQLTFQTLFGGGRAELVLLDESDVLESGIDIAAQPPGKRLQSIQLLSGGEKALTAMALMFAIFKYRPSPFCLLDEIDAPLDDANIGRFVQMLRGLQDRTQFVLVTHNRKTMEIADRLYGITMEEPGVSKLISVSMAQTVG
jgi:chromosome segregation protein